MTALEAQVPFIKIAEGHERGWSQTSSYASLFVDVAGRAERSGRESFAESTDHGQHFYANRSAVDELSAAGFAPDVP